MAGLSVVEGALLLGNRQGDSQIEMNLNNVFLSIPESTFTKMLSEPQTLELPGAKGL